MKSKKTLILGLMLLFVVGFGGFYKQIIRTAFTTKTFHSEKEREFLKEVMQKDEVLRNPIDTGQYFLHSSECKTCHGFDTLHYANIDANGVSVNVYDDWESTMMANSATDPLWRAKVSHEILVNPGHSLQLQDKCTSCHAPMGHYTSKFHGNTYYTINDLIADSLGLNGVSCLACHTIGPDGLGQTFSGHIPFDTNRVVYGPYTNPNAGPMQLYVGMTPTYSAHMSEGAVCSSCHTLIVDGADLAGNPTGRSFIEQATFHEWKNSAAFGDNVTCQNCHMPRVEDSVIIANQYLNLPPRAPFNRHKFMGGNEFMVRLIKNNKAALGITVPDKHFDSTVVANVKLLQEQTLTIDLTLDSLSTDTAFVKLRLTNKAGHKFPSGYPSRRAVVQLISVSNAGDTLFKSGLFTPDFALQNAPPSHQPHYDVISDETKTQVYEMIIGDVNGDKTTVLERADTTLKDNRIPPEGFQTSIPLYDTVRIVGAAETDPDFNKYSGGTDGSGQDYVHYHIAVTGLSSTFKVVAKVYFQSVSPEWLQEMFTYNSQPIDDFRNMFNAADKTPVMIGSDSLVNLAIGMEILHQKEYAFVASPSVTSDGWVNIRGKDLDKIKLLQVHNMAGQTLRSARPEKSENSLIVRLPETPGLYIISLYVEDKRISLKVLRQ
ncbi:MAG: Por secretion system C-terminal sorting protein [Bacteroidetes bacterium]|jgi:hypothetical protein|nr:Por secretion system C-terminal sorting protein [Bacteroidota bacterium]